MTGPEWNKIAAAVLLAGLIAMLSAFFARELVPSEKPAEPAYAVAPAESPSAAAAPAADTGPAPVAPLLAAADSAAGMAAARVCQACHTFEKGGAAKVGPNLWGIVGAPHAHAEGFAYSKAIAAKDGPWTYEDLNQFLYNPKSYAPGTKMSFAGLRKDTDRANVIAFLRSLADEPAPLPVPTP